MSGILFETEYREVEREPDQADILATALYLSQNRPELFGMSAVMWVEEAIHMRKRIAAITGVFYTDNEEAVEELAQP